MATPAQLDPWDDDPEAFIEALGSMSEEEFLEFVDELPPNALQALVQETASLDENMPGSPMEQAMQLEPNYVVRPHLSYISERLAIAVADVEGGKSRKILVSLPPRTGKSEQISKWLPVWLLRRHPTWKFALVSYSPALATGWSQGIRDIITRFRSTLGVEIPRNSGAIFDWRTTAGGEIHARSIGQGLTGFGANVLIIDDPIKDSIAAHQKNTRDTVWSRWTNDLQSRLEGATLVIIVQTRWHEDDLSGRMIDATREDTDPGEWEVISFPAIAVEHDVLGREPGDPLYPPLVEMVQEKALEWWTKLKRGMSSYNWAAMYQQRPAAAQGTIFNVDWWRYWTTDPSLVSGDWVPSDPDDISAEFVFVPDGKVILLPDMTGAKIIDSWDLNFDDTVASDFVVGQRWASRGQDRYLLDQRRGRWNFPATLDQFREWNADRIVSEHIVEKKANGAAMIATLKTEFPDATWKPESPTASKEVRARSTTAEIEHGHVLLPHPLEFTWVKDLQDELRDFPSGVHDDQVDVLSQALNHLRVNETGGLSDPNEVRKRMQERGGPAGTPGQPFKQNPLTQTRFSRGLAGGRNRG
jgi:predicted phage terminase large subunit-like protein